MRIAAFSIIFVYMAVGMIRSIGIFPVLSMEFSIGLLSIAGLAGLVFLNSKQLTSTQFRTGVIFVGLFLYTALFSINQSISIILCFFILAACTLFISLLGADNHYCNKYHQGLEFETTNFPITDSAKYAFILWSFAHALSLVFFYLFTPERTTGLMDDFSQASMLLLLAYGLAYPLLKNKIYFSAFSLIIFVGYFTTFSRTANFLLIGLLALLLVFEFKNGNAQFIFKLVLLAIAALVFVYAYPHFVGQESVDRGGLSQFSTLNSRTIYWQTAWEAIKQKPLLGHGLGTYSYTGINEAQPFNIILYVHNDYLQIWHDLGLFWFSAFIGTFFYLLLKYAPINWKVPANIIDVIDASNPRKYLAWSLLICIALYMGINFLILNIEFQVAIAILLVDLLRK